MLIASKIAMPILRQQLLQRPRLIERLQAGAAGKLTLVSAPGGFGKTSLVCQWLEQQQMPVAWYSIDEGDVEQGRFFQYVLASLVAAAGDIQEALDPLIQGETELIPMEVIGRIIVAMQHHSERLVLVLDDYQMVESSEIHDSVAFLLRYLPPSLHLVIVSRQEPPIALAKFRAMGEVSELHAHSLKFSPDESSTILQGVANNPLDEWQELEIQERTEGWPMGIQLAGLSLREPRAEAPGTGRASPGGGAALDAMLEEVLQAQPAELVHFLLATSILPRFCAGLCNTLLDIDNADAHIRHLEKTGAFIIPLDENNRWYRYHHLFAEMLKSRLEQSGISAADLHKRASHWFAGRGELHEAFDHAFASRDMQFAIGMLSDSWMDLLGAYALSSARHWLDKVPPREFEQNILLRMFRLSIMLSQEELSGFELQLKSLESTLAQGPDKHSTRHYQYVQALLGPARSIYLYLNGQPDEALVEAEHAITAAPADLPLARCLALVGLAYACAEKGEPLKALPLAEEAIALSQQVRQTHLLVLMIALKARLLLGRGKLREAEQVLVNSFSDVLHLEFVKSSNVVHMIAQLAALHYRRNELDKALEQSQKCIRYATLQQANESLLESYTVAALTLQAQGKARQASDMMEEARIIGAATAAPLRERGVELAAIELALLQGELDSVTAWADARELSANQPYSDSWEQSALLKAKFLLHRGEFEQAASIAELLKPRAEKRQRYDACLKADLVHVSALQALGQEEPARKILERAVECFAPEGYVRPFVEHAEYLQDLLLSLRNSRTEAVRQYLPTLLQACQAALEPASRSRRIELEHGVELTPREAEILQFIATGMSNKEIAATAFVSLSTVKTHINHIFQKLDVGNRKDMIRKARELEIISG